MPCHSDQDEPLFAVVMSVVDPLNSERVFEGQRRELEVWRGPPGELNIRSERGGKEMKIMERFWMALMLFCMKRLGFAYLARDQSEVK